MSSSNNVVRAAVVQAASVAFDMEGSLAKVAKYCKEAAKNGAQLAVFPEAFLTCYPRGATFGVYLGNRTPEGRKLFQRYWESSVEIPSQTTATLGQIARENKLHLVIGVIERDGHTLYCTILFYNDAGEYLGKHRKLMPTAAERLVWGFGDGSTLPVYNTKVGKIGAVICWENYMPMLRMSMYSKGIQIYCAPTADFRDGWLASMQHIALEGRCFVLSCNQFARRSDYPPESEYPTMFENKDDPNAIVSRGGSCIINPMGQILAGPNYVEETVLYADLDLDEVVRGKFDFDVVGHYSRPDVFTLHVNEKPNSAVVSTSSFVGHNEEGRGNEDGINAKKCSGANEL
jgi:predicted amidohydrolase